MMTTDRRSVRITRMAAVLVLALLMVLSGFTSAFAYTGESEEAPERESEELELDGLQLEGLELDELELEEVDGEEKPEEGDGAALEDEVENGDASAEGGEPVSEGSEPEAEGTVTEEPAADPEAPAEGTEEITEETEEKKDTDYTSYTSSDPKLEIVDISYDPDKKVVEFKFNTKIQYKTRSNGEKNVVVKVTKYGSSKNQVTSLKKCSSKKLTVNSKKLKYGYKYKFSISGIRRKGTTKYITITGSFRAIK